MDASGRGALLNRLADLMERDRNYLAVRIDCKIILNTCFSSLLID